MTIDEAIKIQTDYLNNPFLNFHQDLRESMKLGFEALKRVKVARIRKEPSWGSLLPGETEDLS